MARRILMIGVVLSAYPPNRLSAQCPDGTPPPCAGARPAPRNAALSVAVLYFDNQSRDSGDAYLADGLTEQTIAQLGEVSRLTVSSRYAVRRFRAGADQDPASVGRALNVAYLVTGSVRRAGNRLRIGVELLRAGTGVRIWGEQFDRTDADILRIQDEIAASVATGIVGQLLPAERRAVSSRATRNPAAYDHFLRGNFHLARRDGPSMLRAIRSYQAAIAIDPGFTDAVARVAYTYGLCLDNEFDIGLPRDSMIARGIAMAERAIRLDSLSSEAWLARAYLRMAEYPRTFEGAGERFERAIALNPRSAEAHHQFASYLIYMGDTARSRVENFRALELEPGRAITWHQLSSIAMLQRQYGEARRFSDSAEAADPDNGVTFALRFAIAMSTGDTAGARRATTALLSNSAWQPVGHMYSLVLDELGGRAAPARPFHDFIASFPASPVPPAPIIGGYTAMLMLMLGDREAALTILERIEPRGGRIHDLLRFELFDPIRADPRFQAVWTGSRVPGSSW